MFCEVILTARSHLKWGSLDKAHSQYILSSSQGEKSRWCGVVEHIESIQVQINKTKVSLQGQLTTPWCLPWWCNCFWYDTLGYCIMMDADLRSQPLRLLDHTMMLTMVISLVLMYHTWILHHDGGWPLESASEASGPNHNAYHVVIIGFHVSHLVIASWWWPTSKVSLRGQWTLPWC